ncbi:MAG TPA: tetratricopeptide repeat protein [Bryobacteraceae bacterium]|nr:tetratricopeptide repeat protein [Bryobacteraceae bacterium]
MSWAAIGPVFLIWQLTAQTQRPNPSGMPGTPGSVSSPSSPNSPNFGSTAPGSIGSGRTGPMLLTGKVVLNDGNVPSEPVRIERVCNDRSGGRPHPEGFTDLKGRFSITLGQEQDIMADASETQSRGQMPGNNPLTGISQAELMNCELRAVLPGFRSDSISLATRRYLDNPDVGTIVLHRMANVEGLTVSATSALAPKDARKAYEKGLEDARKSKPDDAQKQFEKAVAEYPKYASAWFQLGVLDEQRGQPEEARKAYMQSIAADSNYINPYERLYLLDAKQEKWKDVAATSDRVLHLNPYDFPGAFYFNAVANFELGNLDAAEKSGREAVKLDKTNQNPRTNYVLGIILAKKGEFAPAAECLRAYLQAAPAAKDADTVRQQIAELEKSAGGHPQ